jgi:hypothetical protein
MSAKPKSITFNRYGPLADVAPSDELYADDPAVRLTERYEHPRHPAQAAALTDALRRAKLRRDRAAAAIFGPSDLDWAYKVFDWADWGAAGDGPDTPPAACVTAEERAARIRAAAGEPITRRRILLFNVVVALEWAPDRAYLLQLQWAFRRASDFLYDATDGMMAFGQVVFGGPELLSCADIQVMASNRMHPRSWVGGLLKPEKYQPIRVGRGVWHDRNHVTLPWDEPEGYRTLVHEWCHYALSLMDGYVERRRTESGDDVVVPTIQMTSTSIMESLEGTSELFSQEGVRAPSAREDAWAVIAAEFPQLIRPGELPEAPLNGPARLPLPLPVLRVSAALPAAGARALLPLGAGDAYGLAARLTAALRPGDALADYVRAGRLDLGLALAGRVWVHVVQRDAAGQVADVIAQGTLDSPAIEAPFTLLGARAGDQVHVSYESPLGTTVVCVAELREDRGAVTPGEWRTLPAQLRALDVVPLGAGGEPSDGGPPHLRIRLNLAGDPRPVTGTVTEQGRVDGIAPRRGAAGRRGKPGAPSLLAGDPVPIARLDGHVLLEWANGGVSIAAFSHGGGPPTHGGISPNLDGGVAPAVPAEHVPAANVKTPITAGSSDGRVMIFFDPFPLETDPKAASARQQYYETARVVTTNLHGLELPSPREDCAPASSLYSLAAARPLPADLNPTLVINLDPLEIRPGRRASVFFWLDGKWHALAANLAPACRRFVYLPLQGTRLVEQIADYPAALAGPDDPRAVALRVYWEKDVG